MTHLFRNRSRLLGGCASTAVALALALAPVQTAAQGIRADGTFVLGNGQVVTTGPNSTRVDLFAPTVVIDWIPNEDAAGNALDFIGTGSSAEFRNTQSPNFAVLNRILPSTNNNIMTIDGSVISRFIDASGASIPAGTVAFYSPTGILIGGNASFDVGSLLLTTLDTSNTDFQFFAESGGFMTLAATPGSTARVEIAPGAQILATPENAFFAVVAADVEMRGTALVNGSHAYIAGEVVNLSFSNGLFNIFVPVGTAASGEVVTVDGTVGGPSSTGLTGDNHMIYGVAHAQNDPISMLFRGNLGFDPAQSAGIVNGEIILAANYDVIGRFVAGGTIGDGINATFEQTDGTSNVRADIFVEDFASSSTMLAIGTHRVQATAFNTASSVAGNLLLVGRENASLLADNGQGFTISGDVLVDARDYGASSSSLQSLDALNAQGGNAVVNALAGSTVTINGNALVTAAAFGGADFISGIAGNATGGNAQIGGVGGTVTITGSAEVSAAASTQAFFALSQAANARGGIAQINATQGGSASVGQSLSVLANAIAGNGSTFSSSSVSNAYGGQALISVFEGGGTLTVGGAAFADASATGGTSNNAGAGSIGDAGEAVVSIDGPGLITFGDAMRLEAVGRGGDNVGGIGGAGLGGRATAVTFTGGTIGVSGDFDADALGLGGAGQDGGDGLGGIAGAIATLGQITIGGNAFAGTEGVGGDASLGFGGNGGIGRAGNAAFQATGSLTQTATLTITGDALAFAQGTGGRGGQTDGQAIPAGRGGDGYGGQFTVPNQADPAFNSGAFILAGGDNGNITVGGEATAVAQGYGGDGGAGSISGFDGGQGGNGFGGLAQIGLALLGFNGSVGQGSANFGNIFAQADGFGGDGGLSGLDFPTGDGGSGTGGQAALTVRAGDITADFISLSANGNGGSGTLGGLGQGGEAAIFGSLGGTLNAADAIIRAVGFGGFSGYSLGGDGLGGTAAIEGDGISATFDFVSVDASGLGGGADAGSSGTGTGGEAYIAFTTAGAPGAITVNGHAQVFADGVGGFNSGAFAAGDGFGGLARIEAQGGGDITLGSAQVTAIGQGGFTFAHESGDGTGGTVRLLASGAGSTLTIQRNVPDNQTETRGGASMLNANGVGEGAFGGSGIGGIGRGGTLDIRAAQGGTMTLPTNIAADPNSAAPTMLFLARGIGGTSEVDGGTGGAGFGGTGLIEVDGAGSAIIMGETVFSVYGEGGSSALSTSNVTGGAGFGGIRRIRVLNSGSASLQMFGGTTGGIGGNGSGTGDGGDAFGGRNALELVSGTLNVAGDLMLFDEATGGSGVNGGDAFGGLGGEGGGVFLSAADSTINLLPGGNSTGRILVGGSTRGGVGSVSGGLARSPAVAINLTGTTVNGGAFLIEPIASGGQATNPDGVGGNGQGGTILVNLTGSTLNLFGTTLISDTVFGGTGGFVGQGGNATSSAVDVIATNSAITLQTNQVGAPGSLLVFSRTVGGLGGVVGNATSGRAVLRLTDSALSAAGITVSSNAFAAGQSGQTGGIATADQSLIDIIGTGSVNAGTIDVVGNAITSAGGNTQAGSVTFQTAAGSTATVTANTLTLAANAFGGFANGAGVFAANILGGNVTVGSLQASVFGDVIPTDQAASTLSAVGGNLNVTGVLNASALGDIVITTGQGGIIGSPASGGTTTAITIDTRGNIIIDDDDSGLVGLGGRSISLNAGGSILLDGNMATADGAISIFANNGSASPLPSGITTVAEITMTAGTLINAGTGTVTIRMGDGGGVAGRLGGAITLANISAGLIDVRNFGTDTGSDITVLGSGVLTASGSGRAIDLASLNGEVINLHGDAGLILTGGGHYGIFAATPTGSQIGSFANYARRYNVADAAAYDALNPGGNFAAFRIVPFLTVTPDDITRFYGNITPALTASFAGFLPGDSIADLLGAPELTTLANGTSGVGVYAINLALGTLLSEQGYQFSLGSGAGQLTIIPRPITVTANNLSRIYGNANPALTFAVGGLGLVNGDQLSGALATAANATTGVGSFSITQGTLAASANYALTFVDGALTITPRPITITADSFSRIYGNANPALTFSVGGLGLVNGDQLSGALATAANAATGVGTFAITQGTLAAGANYALTFTGGALTITPRPITVTADDLSRIYGNANPALTFSVGGLGLVNGDQLSGALATAANAATGVGTFAITQGTLAASANYALTFTGGALTITPRPITVTADSLSRIYGNANPTLTFSVGGLGLVNGDQLTGALATAANATTGVGTFAITQGTLAASSNYSFTFVNGALTITPRPITITADNLAKFAGQPDPLLTFTVGGDGLVNNDQLTGNLVREAGEALRNFAIQIGSLAAGPNYLVTFVAGQLTINPPPAPPEVNNPISLTPVITPTDPTPTATDEEEARFGIDFPEQPDAPLIEEEVLLDEPVTSGGDPTLYSSGVTPPPAGGQ